MSEASNRLVQKSWSYCQVLRDDGRAQRKRLLTWIVLPTLAACAAGSHHHTDADTFVELLERGPESVRNCSLIGTAEGRAYLTVWSNLPGWLGGGEHICSPVASG